MRLTALCICGTLLAIWDFAWTSADAGEEVLLGDEGLGPCAATLRPEGPCRLGQDDGTCPFIISLPPLTVQLPNQLRELEKIMMDVQKLKDNVDELRKMCEDCTVSQSERECGRQRESGCETLTEGTDDQDWMNERQQENDKECRTDRAKPDKTTESEDLERTTMDTKEGKKWEADRKGDRRVIESNGKDTSQRETAENDRKKGGKGKDKPRQAKVPASGGIERGEDLEKEQAVVKDKQKDGKSNSKGDDGGNEDSNRKERKTTTHVKSKEKTDNSDHHMWHHEVKETENSEEDRGHDGTKMSWDHDRHTNKDGGQQGVERKKEMERGIKVERNNEKPKQIESTGLTEKEKTIKEGAVEEDSDTGKEIKTEGEKSVQSVQRDSDGELASSKAMERTDFVSISPTPHSTISLVQRPNLVDLDEAETIASSLPSPPLSSPTSYFITDIHQGVTVSSNAVPTPSTHFGTAGTNEYPSTYAESVLATAGPSRPLEGPGQTITRMKDRVSSATASSATAYPRQNFFTTISPEGTDRSHWTTKKNIGLNSKTVEKPPPSQRPKPGGKHKPGIKPVAEHKLKYDHKPKQASLPGKKIKQDQRLKPSPQKPTNDQIAKPGKGAKRVPVPKPSQRHRADNSSTSQSLKNPVAKHNQNGTRNLHQETTGEQNSDLNSNPAQTHVSQNKDNKTSSDKMTESDETLILIQKPKPEKKPIRPFKTNKPDQRLKPEKKLKGEEKTKSEKTSKPNHNLKPVQEIESERGQTIKHKPDQEIVTESADKNPSKLLQDSTPGLTPTSTKRPRSNQKIPKSPKQVPKPGQLPKPNQKFVPGQKSKPNVKPKSDQEPQARPDHKPKPTSVSDQNPKAESNKTSKRWPHLRHRPPSKPTLKPGATPAGKPKPAVKPSPKAKTHSEPPQISRTMTESIQSSPTYTSPTYNPVKRVAELTHSPQDAQVNPSTMKTTSVNSKMPNILETGPALHPHTLPEGFTMSPNRRIMSDLSPQTTRQPSSIPMTTSPNQITRGIFQGVIPSTGPGSTKKNLPSDGDLQTNMLGKEETPQRSKMTVPVPSPSPTTTSTVNADLRSTTPATFDPQATAPESSTSSARELRVKINQVAAFLNNSLSPNGRSPDRHLRERPEDKQRGSRPDGKRPPLTPWKVSMARRDCSDHLLRGERRSEVLLVTPNLRSRSFPVLCDMELDGGGWTVIQQRRDGSVSFNRTWAEYRAGFGNLSRRGDFWLGNNQIHLLTWDRDMMLRVELEDFDGVMEFAEYEHFRVAGERMLYRLTVGGYSGTAGDALRFSNSYDHNNRSFTTPDRDHDRYPSGNCGAYYSSGWWFDACMSANLNGRYYVGKYKGVRDGIFWGTWHNISIEYYPTNERQSFKTVRMMIRPKGFTP